MREGERGHAAIASCSILTYFVSRLLNTTIIRNLITQYLKKM